VFDTTLRKVDGAMMLSVPPAVQDLLHLKDGETVALAVAGEKLVIKQHIKPHYTLDELLARCEPSDEPFSEEERIWFEAPPTGREL